MTIPPQHTLARGLAAGVFGMCVGLAQGAQAHHSCPRLFHKGTLSLDFNPAFVHVDRYDHQAGQACEQKRDGLTISSFFNAQVVPGGTPPVTFFERDLVARIPDIGDVDLDSFDPETDLEELTDLAPGMPKTVWPNEAERVPDGVLPFEAVIIPQGFLSAQGPGRLTLVDVASKREYLVHQSTELPSGPTAPLDPTNSPRFYHRAVFLDMDGDGLKDIVTVRSGFRARPNVYPPFGELVWFKNPGDALDPDVPWQETILYGGPAAGFLGPDIALDVYDFEGDGVPEIVANHFFSVPADPNGPPPSHGKISIYGAPVGGTWADVDATLFRLPRVNDISTDQGRAFDVQIVDLNGDGKVDVLATNHQPDGCTPMTSSEVPGRVYALEQPASGDLFGDAWQTHILLDDIRPQPTPPPIRGGGRLAPGHAQAFHPVKGLRHVPGAKPWIVVGGDEAGKVWLLRPTRRDFEYRSAVVFDINAHYGPNTTQTPMLDPFGITISTIGRVGVRYDRPGPFGLAELYIPVFEGQEIQVLSFRPSAGERVQCAPDETLACTP